MKSPLVILESGFLGRSENTLTFENVNVERKFPVKNFDSIFLMGEVSLNTKLLHYLAKEQIPVFFFSYNGHYSGVYMPKKTSCFSGNILIEQVKHYIDTSKRLFIAKEMVYSSIYNMRKTLLQYSLKKEAEKLKDSFEKISSCANVDELLSTEANARKFYYQQFNKIIRNKAFHFTKRSSAPPKDLLNCLISFGNTLLYNTILSEMYKTRLSPMISYLHTTTENRYSLNLDLADIFKPLIVDRVIFALVNQNMIKEEHGRNVKQGIYLNDAGKRIFIRQYEAKLNSSLSLQGQDNKVSYKYLLRRECYSLIEHLESKRSYSGFRIWW